LPVPRRLHPDEASLWQRVTADVRPSGAPAFRPTQPDAQVTSIPKPLPAPTRRPVDGPAHPPTETLDARWDKDLRVGRANPDRIVDLHGCTLDTAHRLVLAALSDALSCGERLVVVVTGKPPPAGSSRLDLPLRGIIRASLNDWLRASPQASRIAAIRPAHARHGGAGAVYVVLRRQRSAKRLY